MGYSVGKEDLKVIPLLKSLAAELLGTMLLVIFGCGTAMQVNGDGYSTKVSLAFGLAVMAIACFTGHVSGGQFSHEMFRIATISCQATSTPPSPLGSSLAVSSRSSSAASTLSLNAWEPLQVSGNMSRNVS